MNLKCQLRCLNTWFLVGGTVSGLGEAGSGYGPFRRWSFAFEVSWLRFLEFWIPPTRTPPVPWCGRRAGAMTVQRLTGERRPFVARLEPFTWMMESLSKEQSMNVWKKDRPQRTTQHVGRHILAVFYHPASPLVVLKVFFLS